MNNNSLRDPIILRSYKIKRADDIVGPMNRAPAPPLTNSGASAGASTANPFIAGGGESGRTTPLTAGTEFFRRMNRQNAAMDRAINTGPPAPPAASPTPPATPGGPPPTPTPSVAPGAPQTQQTMGVPGLINLGSNAAMSAYSLFRPGGRPTGDRFSGATTGPYQPSNILAGAPAGGPNAKPLAQMNPGELPNKPIGGVYQQSSAIPSGLRPQVASDVDLHSTMPQTVATTTPSGNHTRQPMPAYQDRVHPDTQGRMDPLNADMAQENQLRYGSTGLNPLDDELFRQNQVQPSPINNIIQRGLQKKPDAVQESVQRMNLYKQLEGKVPPDSIMGTMKQIWDGLDGNQQIMLGLGLGLGAIGLLSSGSGMMGGPSMGMLGPLLAIGGLGLGAHQSGLLGNLTGGALGHTNAGWSGQPRPEVPINAAPINSQELMNSGVGTKQVDELIKAMNSGDKYVLNNFSRHDSSAQALMKKLFASNPAALSKLEALYGQMPGYQKQVTEYNQAWDQKYGGPTAGTAIDPNTPPGASPQARAGSTGVNPPPTEVRTPGAATPSTMPPRGGAQATPASTGINQQTLAREIQSIRSNPVFDGLITSDGKPDLMKIGYKIDNGSPEELKAMWTASPPELRKYMVQELTKLQQTNPGMFDLIGKKKLSIANKGMGLIRQWGG